MKRSAIISRSIILSVLTLVLNTALSAQQPNIVHILVDDLGWQDVACYYRDYHNDEPFYETPHLDRLASRGIRFMQAYSPAMTCAPSRAAFMTGQFTPHNGVYHVNMGCQIPRPRRDTAQMLDPYYVGRIMPGKPIIAEELKKAGYTTAHVGKWHISGASGFPSPIQVGFDFSFDEHKEYNDPEIYDASDPKIANFSGLFAQPKDRLSDAFTDPRFPLLEGARPYDSMVDLSTRWIGRVARGDKPFFLNLCPNLVHGPVMTRDRKRLAHYCKKLGIPFPTDPGSISDPDKPGQHNPYYASMVDSVDWIVGQIVQTLETTDDPRNPGHKLIDNTYVVVSSDNGGGQRLRNWKNRDGKLQFEKVTDNAPLREGKGWAYEGGCRTPLIVMGPNIQPGEVNDSTPVNLIDLFPTFLTMAGAERDGSLDLDGCNILPVMQGQDHQARFADGKPRDTLYFHYPVLNSAFSTIRRGPWKLMKNTGGPMNPAPSLQLFRLYNDDGSAADLGERKNVATQFPEQTKQLLGDLDQWLGQHQAGQPYRNAAYRKGDLPGQKNVTDVTDRVSEGSRIWATFETGRGKAQIVDAFLLYTINPGREEEWFRAAAKLSVGRVETTAPPGMTHGVFCLIDENNFLIHSEPIPVMTEYGIGKPISAILKDGYAWKPGLSSLIECAESAARNAGGAGKSTARLETALKAARATRAKPDDAKRYSTAIDRLRREIRMLRDVPEAQLDCISYFPLAEKPNILFILVDDMGWRDLACFGHEIHETPNIDGLASQGMRFTNAYAACPICAPSRAAIMTGKFPSNTGFVDNFASVLNGKTLQRSKVSQFLDVKEVTLADALQGGGYQTGFLGKWHLSVGMEPRLPTDQGFDVNVAGSFWGRPLKGYFSPYQMPNLEDGPKGEYLPDRLTTEAIRVMDDFSKQDKPWLLYMSYYTVHGPFHSKPEKTKKYAAKARQAKVKLKNPAYAGMIESLDENVGRMVQWLEEKGLRKNTIIVFTSDNGGMVKATENHPLRSYKGDIYEGGIRVPCIIDWPGVTKSGSVSDTPINGTDFYATLLAMAGLPQQPQNHQDSVNLAPLLQGDSNFQRGPLVWHYPVGVPHIAHSKPGSVIRSGDWKFLRFYEDGREELYNLKNDIGETKNLVASMPKKAAELKAQLDAALKTHGATIPTSVPAKPSRPARKKTTKTNPARNSEQ